MYKILVIGEQCTDIFIYGKVDRLSPEGPVPIFQPVNTVCSGGMAQNVVNNLSSLGCDVYSVFNTDTEIRKTRYVDVSFNHLFLRVDENDECGELDISTLPNLSNFDVIIISDYDKGFITPSIIQYVSSLHSNVIIDTKKVLGEWARNLKFIKLNRMEYQKNINFINNNDWILEKLIITLDKGGARYKDIIYSTDTVDVLDVSGAGDTFIAGFVYKYLASNDVSKSIEFANKCALQVIQKKGVSVVSVDF